MTESHEQETKSEARSKRRGEVFEEKLQINSYWLEGTREPGKDLEYFRVRDDRPNWAKTNPFVSIDREVVEQLISQVSFRLKRVNDHISEYQDEKHELVEQLEALKAIQSAIEHQSESSEEE